MTILPEITQNITNIHHQHGFKTNHFTTTALHKITNTITAGFVKNSPSSPRAPVAKNSCSSSTAVLAVSRRAPLAITRSPVRRAGSRKLRSGLIGVYTPSMSIKHGWGNIALVSISIRNVEFHLLISVLFHTSSSHFVRPQALLVRFATCLSTRNRHHTSHPGVALSRRRLLSPSGNISAI